MNVSSLISKVQRGLDKREKRRCEEIDSDTINFPNLAGQTLLNRYSVQKTIGKGAFGQVILATDLLRDELVAIKVIRPEKIYIKQAETEVEILKTIRDQYELVYGDNEEGEEDPPFVRILHHFMLNKHPCIVFEHLSFNLYEAMRIMKMRGFPLSFIRHVGQSLLSLLSLFSSSQTPLSLQGPLIHCDIKPENIMVEAGSGRVKLIDFGVACYDGEQLYKYIQSRFYRAPEVTLQIGYNTSMDVWSLGAVLAELWIGSPLFPARDQHELLLMIQTILEPIPDEMIENMDEKKRNKYFEERLPIQNNIPFSSTSNMSQFRLKSRASDVRCEYWPCNLEQGLESRIPKRREKCEFDMLVDLVSKCLVIDPDMRLDPSEGLDHPFFGMLSQGEEEDKNAKFIAKDKKRCHSILNPIQFRSMVRGEHDQVEGYKNCEEDQKEFSFPYYDPAMYKGGEETKEGGKNQEEKKSCKDDICDVNLDDLCDEMVEETEDDSHEHPSYLRKSSMPDKLPSQENKEIEKLEQLEEKVVEESQKEVGKIVSSSTNRMLRRMRRNSICCPRDKWNPVFKRMFSDDGADKRTPTPNYIPIAPQVRFESPWSPKKQQQQEEQTSQESEVEKKNRWRI